MGNCFCSDEQTVFKSRVAIKFPHGIEGIEYSDDLKCFIPCKDLNGWLQSLYHNTKITQWVIYNDESDDIVEKGHHTKGHCKGIVAWNETLITWLCHSVPNFPREFTSQTISEIEKSELLYGQSFQYTEFPYHNDTLTSIMQQLTVMEANIYCTQHHFMFAKKINREISTIVLSPTITHIAKSPHYSIDMYSECIAKRYPSTWHIETWKRGHAIQENMPSVKDIKTLHYGMHKFKESQDHSKWAVGLDGDWICPSDINRMTTQYNRGGSAFCFKNPTLRRTLLNAIVSTDTCA